MIPSYDFIDKFHKVSLPGGGVLQHDLAADGLMDAKFRGRARGIDETVIEKAFAAVGNVLHGDSSNTLMGLY